MGSMKTEKPKVMTSKNLKNKNHDMGICRDQPKRVAASQPASQAKDDYGKLGGEHLQTSEVPRGSHSQRGRPCNGGGHIKSKETKRGEGAREERHQRERGTISAGGEKSGRGTLSGGGPNK